MKKYLVIIPTYNEAINIERLLKEIIGLNIVNLHVLVVDDNSPDGTGLIVRKNIKKYPNKIFILDRKKKEGLGRAYIAGFKWALQKGYQNIISMDADFSHDPKYLPDLIDKSNDYDVVIGSRYVKGGSIVGWQWHRYLNSWGANFMTRLLLGLKQRDVTAGFKCYSRNFLESLDLDKIISNGYAFQVEMVNLAHDLNCNIIEVPITFIDRRAGESKISGELKRSIKVVLELAKRKKTYWQFIKFGIVGFIGTVIDLGIYNLLAIIFGFNIYFSRVISFTLATSNNYILNRKWTFQSHNKKIIQEFGKFFFISIIGLGMNLGIMKIINPLVKDISSEIIRKNIPVIIAIIIVLFWNYFSNKLWTFKDKK